MTPVQTTYYCNREDILQHLGRHIAALGKIYCTTWEDILHHLGRYITALGNTYCSTWEDVLHHLGRYIALPGKTYCITWEDILHHLGRYIAALGKCIILKLVYSLFSNPSPFGYFPLSKGKIVCESLRIEYDIENYKFCETSFLCEKSRTSLLSPLLKGTSEAEGFGLFIKPVVHL